MTGDPWRWVAQVAEAYGGPDWIDSATVGAQTLLVAVILAAVLTTAAIAVRSRR